MRAQRLTFLHMVSGAGQDTMYMAALTRAALFFVPCEKGISHNKEEAVTDEAVQNGLKLMLSVLLRICNLDPEVEKEKADWNGVLLKPCNNLMTIRSMMIRIVQSCTVLFMACPFLYCFGISLQMGTPTVAFCQAVTKKGNVQKQDT